MIWKKILKFNNKLNEIEKEEGIDKNIEETDYENKLDKLF